MRIIAFAVGVFVVSGPAAAQSWHEYSYPEYAFSVDFPADPKIDDPQERARILRLIESRVSEPAGFVLPLQRWTAKASPGWTSEVWRTRRGRLRARRAA